MRSGRPIWLVSLSVLLVGLSAAPSFAQTDTSDPWEGINRRFFAFNEGLDRALIGPLSNAYAVIPSPLRTGISNFGRNLGEPVVFVNDLLQGHPGQAASTLGRLAINSTFGLLGLLDVAKAGRIPHHDNGFGTTLGRWGAKPGPYLFLPLYGPSSVRDGLGAGGDFALNPLTYARYPGRIEIGAAVTVTHGLQRRIDAGPELDTVRQTSTDPYATIRSYYLQSRQAEVSGKPVDIETLPDFDTPPAPAGSTTPPRSPPGAAKPTPTPAPLRPGPAQATPPPETTAPPPESGQPRALSLSSDAPI
jgi:phospholipid-binding lipoprotein MlaA